MQTAAAILIALSALTALAAVAAVTAWAVRRSDRRKLEYMLDAFEDGETNFRFKESSGFNKALNRIKWIVERRRQQDEQESWTKLIRVLTHEIMNTVSPIASLSEALCREADGTEGEGRTDVRAGLETIAASSRDLIGFVESYRELAGVARPVMKAQMLDNLVGKVLALTHGQCSAAGVECSYSPKTDDILIYADGAQICRILINLIKNAVEADARHISITAETDADERTTVCVRNDGLPITPESQEQIFIPFFTTKEKGSGIGLSLSRQIMRAHNGTLDLTASDGRGTVFTLTFR